jgi:glutamate dehydrogenase (NAD(P)+)
MHEHGILVVPDFITNAGVICAAVEYRSGIQRAAFEYIDELIRANARAVWKRAGPTRHFRSLQPLR